MTNDAITKVAPSKAHGNGQIWGPLILGASLLVVLALRYWAFTIDDAFISLRYAQHLVEGKGLVFNVGERVEGFTNFSWTLLGAGILGVGLEPITGLKCVGLICALITVWFCLLIFRHFEPQRPAFLWLLAFLVAGAPCTVVWAVGGLETMLFAALLSITVYLYLIDKTVAGWPLWPAVCALATMTRPEGLLAFPIIAVHRVVTLNGKWRKELGRVIIIFLIMFGPFFLWRVAYYGDVLPNTYYAKVAGKGLESTLKGSRYLLEFMRSYCGPVALVLLGWAAMVRRNNRSPIILLALVVAYFITPLKLGADWMPQFRYLAPYWPLAAVTITLGAVRISDMLAESRSGKHRRWTRRVTCALIAGSFALSFAYQVILAYDPGHPRYGCYGISVLYHTRATERFIAAGQMLARIVKPGETLAAFAVGAIPYYTDLPTYDIWGLNSKTIAQQSWPQRVRYVLSLEPTYIENVSHELGVSGMAQLPEFQKYYERLGASFPESSIFVRKDARR